MIVEQQIGEAFAKFLDAGKLKINNPFINVMLKISNYSKFLKEMLTNSCIIWRM